MLSALDRRRTPQARLKGLIRALVDQRELAAKHGCPFGTLACELDKRADGPDRNAADVMGILVGWAERQFRSMGLRDQADARDLAIALVASYEGVSLLTNTFRDPELMVREGRRLERWIDSLASGVSPRDDNRPQVHALCGLRLVLARRHGVQVDHLARREREPC